MRLRVVRTISKQRTHQCHQRVNNTHAGNYSTSHTLREIARLIDIRTFNDGRMIGQQLDRDGIDDRGHKRVDGRQGNGRPRLGLPRLILAIPGTSERKITLPPRATTSWTFAAVLSNNGSPPGAITMTGTSSSTSAMGPCFISPAA